MEMTTYERAEMLVGQFGYVMFLDDDVQPGQILLTKDGEVCIHPSESTEPCQPVE